MASSASAARGPVAVVCQGPLPFGREELVAAIDVRLPLARIGRGRIPAVRVRAVVPNRAVVTVGSLRRVVSLEALAPADAARVVALMTLDLINSHQEPLDSAPAAIERRAPHAAPDRVLLGVSTRLSLGVSQWSPAFEPTLDLSVGLLRYLAAFVELGFTWVRAGHGDGQVNVSELPLRAGVALRYRWVEARAGAVLRPYVVSGAGSDQGALLGGALGLHLRRRFTSWLTGYLLAGVDLFALRKAFRVEGTTALTTSWAIPWLGIGAGWQGG